VANRGENRRRERRERDASAKGQRPLSPHDVALSAIREGLLYLDSDSYSDAIVSFESVLKKNLLGRLEPEERSSLFAGLARSYVGLGKHREARRWVEAMRGLDVCDPAVASEADVILARIESRAGRFRESLVASQRAYKALRELPESRLLADAAKIMGTAHAELGSIGAARDCLVDCLVTNRRLGDQAGVAGAYNNLGILAKRTGDLGAAIDYFEKALEIDRGLGRTAAVARRLNNLGVALYRMSRWNEAEKRLLDALEIYIGLGAKRDVVAVELALGNVLRAKREWGVARSYLERGLATAREFGYRRSEALALEFLGELEADRGHHEEALELLDTALSMAYQLSASNDAVSEVLRRRAEILLEVGRLDEAERDCAQALELSARLGDRLEEGAALRVFARLLYARGDRTGARQRILAAEEALRRTGESFELARTSFAAAAGLLASSPEDELPIDRIEARLFAAEELFDRVGAGFWVGLCRLERARALRRAGELGRAADWLERARGCFEAGGERAALAKVNELQRQIDIDLASTLRSSDTRYSVIADGYRQLNDGDLPADAFHALAAAVAGAVEADRLVLFEVPGGEGQPEVAISYDRTGRRLAEARRAVRGAVSGSWLRKPLILAGSELPEGLDSAAIFPVSSRSSRIEGHVLYADRELGSDRGPFRTEDIEFLSAAAGMLAVVSNHRGEESVQAREPEEESSLYSTKFVTRDAGVLSILSSVERLRDSDIPILILGESGVGKDVLAREIHKASGRRGRFVALNSGAVPPDLQESELFGHVKGAFTDADRDREGLISAAAGGTLFLDEIGEMSPELQVKLLRFLQSGEYRRVGESVVRTSDARVVSASNRDLREEARAGRFRTDLYYRLGAFVIEIPPLRARPVDIPLLMDHFLRLYRDSEGKRVRGYSRDVKELFLRYGWSENNVRELENEVRRGVALCRDGGLIEVSDLRPELRAMHEDVHEFGHTGRDFVSLKDEVEALERRRIVEALNRSGNSKPQAAEELGLSRTGLYTKLQKYRLE